MDAEAQAAPAREPQIEVTTSRMFNAWLARERASLVLTTYQTGKIFFIGLQPNGRLSVFERTLERVMGMHASVQVIHVSTLYQLWRFRNALKPGETFQGYDAVYVPRESRVTGPEAARRRGALRPAGRRPEDTRGPALAPVRRHRPGALRRRNPPRRHPPHGRRLQDRRGPPLPVVPPNAARAAVRLQDRMTARCHPVSCGP